MRGQDEPPRGSRGDPGGWRGRLHGTRRGWRGRLHGIRGAGEGGSTAAGRAVCRGGLCRVRGLTVAAQPTE